MTTYARSPRAIAAKLAHDLVLEIKDEIKTDAFGRITQRYVLQSCDYLPDSEGGFSMGFPNLTELISYLRREHQLDADFQDAIKRIRSIKEENIGETHTYASNCSLTMRIRGETLFRHMAQCEVICFCRDGKLRWVSVFTAEYHDCMYVASVADILEEAGFTIELFGRRYADFQNTLFTLTVEYDFLAKETSIKHERQHNPQ